METDAIKLMILEYIKENPRLQYVEIRNRVSEILNNGIDTNGEQNILISEEVELFINEIVWDLITLRILTPRIEYMNLNDHWLQVSNMGRLESMLTDDLG